MTSRPPRARPRALRALALVAFAVPLLTAVPAASATTSVTVSVIGGSAHSSFSSPNQITLTPHNGGGTYSLTPGTPSDVNLTSFGFSVGAYPGGVCASGFDDRFDLVWVLSAAGQTQTLTVPFRLRWICNNQGQVDYDVDPSPTATFSLPGAQTLTVTLPDLDAHRSDGVVSGQFPPGYGGSMTVKARLLLSDPADTTPPTITSALSPAAPDGDGGWYRSDVALVWTVTEAESASSLQVTGCLDRTISADQAATTYSCAATSTGGSAGPVSVSIKRDATPPSISGNLSPATPDGDGGWYVTAPTASWLCADATSGVASCERPSTLPQGTTTTLVGSVRDAAGNSATRSLGPVSVDLTNPTVTCAAAPSFGLNQPSAVVTATVADGQSGPTAATVSAAVSTAAVGTHTVNLTGADVAGRTSSATCSYTVGYSFQGFFRPVENASVNVARAGQAIPLKWRVLDAAGNPVTTLTSVSVNVLGRACALGATPDAIEEHATGGSGLQNLGDGYYQLNWATPRSYASSCKTLQLHLGDGVARTAEFSFPR